MPIGAAVLIHTTNMKGLGLFLFLVRNVIRGSHVSRVPSQRSNVGASFIPRSGGKTVLPLVPKHHRRKRRSRERKWRRRRRRRRAMGGWKEGPLVQLLPFQSAPGCRKCFQSLDLNWCLIILAHFAILILPAVSNWSLYLILAPPCQSKPEYIFLHACHAPDPCAWFLYETEPQIKSWSLFWPCSS